MARLRHAERLVCGVESKLSTLVPCLGLPFRVRLDMLSRSARALLSVRPSAPSRLFHRAAVLHAVKPFLLADIGEGITEVEIVKWCVEPGQKVDEFDPVCEVM